MPAGDDSSDALNSSSFASFASQSILLPSCPLLESEEGSGTCVDGSKWVDPNESQWALSSSSCSWVGVCASEEEDEEDGEAVSPLAPDSPPKINSARSFSMAANCLLSP